MCKKVFLSVLVLGGVLAVWIWSGARSTVVGSYDECVDAGNPVMESFPAQCRTKDGQTFVQEIEPRRMAYLACAVADIPLTSVDTVLDRENGSVEVRWTDSVTGRDRVLFLPFDPSNDFDGCSDSAKRVLRMVNGEATEVEGKNPPTSADGAPAGSIHNLPVPKAVAVARSFAAQRAKVNESEVLILTAYEKEWPNACLGMPGNVPEDMMCAEVITPGYEVTLMAKGKEMIYRTNADGSSVRVAK